MFVPREIGMRRLAQLCRRLSTSLEAGIDARTVWAREAEHATGLVGRARIRQISDDVARGESVSQAVLEAGDYFPPLFAALVQVGEETGHLGESFRDLAEHYEQQLEIRRNFLSAITWPLAELVMALGIIGILILLLGMLPPEATKMIAPLVWGLTGESGFAIYLAAIALVAIGLYAAFHAFRRSLTWTRPLQRALLRVPTLGPALQTLALARLAWALHLVLDAGMEVRRGLRLSLDSARNARYTDGYPSIHAAISRGESIFEAMAQTGSYPSEFLDAVQVGEQSGRLVESLALLSKQYHQRANAALKTLTMIAGWIVWIVVAGIIITFIFRLASLYINTLNSALNMKM
jgi:type IV pilus assembly protein PilC